MVDQGLAFTAIIHSGQGFDRAVKIWFGTARGTDWLHSAIERELGEDQAQYEVHSRRDSIHVGASGEVLEVVLTLLGGGASMLALQAFGTATDRLSDSALDAATAWAKQKVARHRKAEGLEQSDGPPDLVRDREPRDLARSLREDLAALLGIEPAAVSLTSATREAGVMRATYRIGEEVYDVVVSGNRADFARRTASDSNAGVGRVGGQNVPLLPWRRRRTP